MEKEFAPYELAVKLKALGFDESCFGYYHLNEGYTKGYAFCYFNEPKRYESDSAVLTPTYSQAFRWFREKHNLRGFIGFRPNVKQFDCHIYDMSLSAKEYVKQRTLEEFNKDPKFETYEEAELACLTKLIELLKEYEDTV